jgi:hypothetical protein
MSYLLKRHQLHKLNEKQNGHLWDFVAEANTPAHPRRQPITQSQVHR